MTMLTTSFNDLLKVDNLMRVIVSDKFNDMVRKQEFDKICNVVSSNRKSEDTTGISDLGRMTKKDEGADVPAADLVQGYDKRITNYSYGMVVAVTPEMMLFEQYGQMKKLGGALATAAAMAKEYLVANIYNYSTSTTDADSLSTAGGDALALLSTSHTLYKSGGTCSNKLSSWTALSYTSLQDVIDLIEATTTPAGMPQALKPSKLLVPRKLRPKALELTVSPYRPDNADNAINAVKEGWTLTPVVNHFITSQTNWYVLADEHDITLQVAKEFGMERDVDPYNRNALYIGSTILGAGFNDFRGVAGSAA